MTERRQYQRIDKKMDIQYRVIYSLGFGSQIKDGHGVTESIDISEGGISFFILDKMIPIGSLLELEIQAPTVDYSIYLKANVVRSEKKSAHEFIIGLKFEYKLDNDMKILHHYLTQK